MTQTQDEQNVQTPVTPAQDTSAATPVTETVTDQPAVEQPVAENTVTPSAEPAPVAQPAPAAEPVQPNQQGPDNAEKKEGGIKEDIKE